MFFSVSSSKRKKNCSDDCDFFYRFERTTEMRAQNVDWQHQLTFQNLQNYQQQHPHGTEAGSIEQFLIQQATAFETSLRNYLPGNVYHQASQLERVAAVLAAVQCGGLGSEAAPSAGIKRQNEAENAVLANKKSRADASQGAGEPHESDTNDDGSDDDESDDDGVAGNGEDDDGVTDNGASNDGESDYGAADEHLLPDVAFTPSNKLYFNAPYDRKNDFIWVENKSDINVKFKAHMHSSNDTELPRLSNNAGYIPAKTTLRLDVSCSEGTKSSDDRAVILEIMNCSRNERMMDREGLYQNWNLYEGAVLRKVIKIEYND
ncbi:Protein CBG27703 [Caenorhabditis briggsae]|uniref:Protein CBG27703 n=2 Tax=Caenorhabditis briggsae TaxID=6238 RepID=B6IJE8_CAEBR|nr:Protein CBG27703 [Caenorhabditis briggsae]CAR99982.1 Protein CBG27703 [Caenorhabditis briggsae]